MDPVDTLNDLIAFPSVSSSSNEPISCRVAQHLEDLGFVVETSRYVDAAKVTKVNLVARRDPNRSHHRADAMASPCGGLAYFCHTDVVPVSDWTGPGGDGFTAVVRDDRVYGRGACDMKGSLVCMLAAASQIAADEQTQPLWIVCTADEEVGFEGATHLVHHSAAYRDIVAAQPLSIIGEPTSLNVVHAHKGIQGIGITSRGRAAHSSTDAGINANEAIVPVLQTMLNIAHRTRTDARLKDERFDPPHLSWTFGVSDGCKAINITPDRSTAWVTWRPMPEIDGEDLVTELVSVAESAGLTTKRFKGGHPVWIDPESPVIESVCQIAGGRPSAVCYGTDAGEFHELAHRVILGPGSITEAHTTDEWIALEQIDRGIQLYQSLIRAFC
jgi:acetylornithine deacetylase